MMNEHKDYNSATMRDIESAPKTRQHSIKSTKICVECETEFNEDDVPKDSEYCVECFTDMCGMWFVS